LAERRLLKGLRREIDFENVSSLAGDGQTGTININTITEWICVK